MAGNAFKRLRGLLPEDTTQVGVVDAVNADGTTAVTLIGGGQVIVAGFGFAPGASVFIKGGRIESGAPALSAVEIEV